MINKFNYWYFKDAIPSHICDQIVETGIQGDLDDAFDESSEEDKRDKALGLGKYKDDFPKIEDYF